MDESYEYLHRGLNACEVYRIARDTLVVPEGCILYVLSVGGVPALVGMKEGAAHDLPCLVNENVAGTPVVSLRYILMRKGRHEARLDPRMVLQDVSIDMFLEVDTKTGGEFFGELTSKTSPF